jgi:hypothetical protein
MHPKSTIVSCWWSNMISSVRKTASHVGHGEQPTNTNVSSDCMMNQCYISTPLQQVKGTSKCPTWHNNGETAPTVGIEMSSEGHTNCAETIAQIKTEKESSEFKGNMDVGGKRTSQRHKTCAWSPNSTSHKTSRVSLLAPTYSGFPPEFISSWGLLVVILWGEVKFKALWVRLRLSQFKPGSFLRLRYGLHLPL